jgi:hypothetical protein
LIHFRAIEPCGRFIGPQQTVSRKHLIASVSGIAYRHAQHLASQANRKAFLAYILLWSW